MKFTQRVMTLAALGLLVAGAQLRAQDVQFTGSTAGCFTTSPSPCATANSATEGSLSFVGGSFNATTFGGFTGIGGTTGSLGSFTLGSDPFNYTGSSFLLDVLFTTPDVSGTSSVFKAALFGSVSAAGNGGVSILFNPSAQIYDFTTGTEAGTFLLSVNNVSLTPNAGAAPITGSILLTSTGPVTATPEPATVGLLATGFVGLIPLYRLRRKKESGESAV